MLTICFTGHRPKSLAGYDHDKYVPFVEELTKRLKTFCKNEPVRFITGGAQGFDQLAFWSVDRIKRELPPEKSSKIENCVYVPFPGQQEMWRDDGLFGQKEYNLMLKRATKTKYCKTVKPAAGKSIVTALMDRNHEMVDSSDIVIALCEHDDWEKPSTRSGTAECMRYAKNHSKIIYQIQYDTDGLDVLKIKNISKHDYSGNTEPDENFQKFYDMGIDIG